LVLSFAECPRPYLLLKPGGPGFFEHNHAAGFLAAGSLGAPAPDSRSGGLDQMELARTAWLWPLLFATVGTIMNRRSFVHKAGLATLGLAGATVALRLRGAENSDTLDFNELVGEENPWSVAYAVCYVILLSDLKDAQLRIGYDEQAKLYLNGKRGHLSPDPSRTASTA
jgi:hypothetical protein